MKNFTGQPKSICARRRMVWMLGVSCIAAQTGAAYAQEETETPQEVEEQFEEVVVTGSRIKGAASSGAIAVSGIKSARSGRRRADRGWGEDLRALVS